MEYQTIRYCPEGKTATIRLNRPHRMNAVIEEMYRELSDLLDTLESDPGIRVIVLTGSVLEKNGKKKEAFCAGADLKKHATGERTREQKKAYITLAHETCRKLYEFPKPVIAAINGPAMGAGAEMALCCDFIIMARTATLGFPETGLGTCTGGGATFHLSRLLGPARAKELIYTGKIIDGEAARNLGIALDTWPVEELMTRVLGFAETLAEKAPISLKLVKQLIQDSQERDLASILDNETEAILTCMKTEDWQEGVKAFAERRKPDYKGV